MYIKMKHSSRESRKPIFVRYVRGSNMNYKSVGETDKYISHRFRSHLYTIFQGIIVRQHS